MRTLNAILRSSGLAAAMFVSCGAIPPSAAVAAEVPERSSKFKDFAEVTKGAKKIEGLFDLYHDDEHLYAALSGSDMNRNYLAPMSVARGVASAGMGLNFDEQWVISFAREGDYVHVIRKNLRYEAPEGTPLKKAVEQNYTDSIIMALPIVSDNPPGGGVLVDLADIFFTDFADLGVGGIDRRRASWHKIKAYPKNLELQVKLTFTRDPMRAGHGGDFGYIDSRGITMVMHYSIVQMPEGGYRPRMADQRVGYFLNATKDFGSDDPDTTFVRRINRWRLEKSDSSADLSPPKKQIVWWVEDNVPHEYRPFVEEGILEWNKAFEKIGFRNALAVRWQNERDEFDPEDINYCTFRWITTPSTFAMSNVRSNPITGEMIDGDVIFDASWIRFWQQEYAQLVAAPAPEDEDDEDAIRLGVGEILSPMMAAQQGYGMPASVPNRVQGVDAHAALHGDRTVAAMPSTWSPFHAALSRKASDTGCCVACQYSASMHNQFRMAAMVLAASGKNEGAELPEELLGQVIKSVVMHEVGHSLGLRHNFRASAMLDSDELHDTAITREKGLVGSVMDYTPVNIARKGEKQGDYATTTLGPYDYWAIEYAYKPISGNEEEEELKKIAARSPEKGLDYATDEDLYDSYDPRVNQYDLGSDGLAFAKHRIALANDVLEDMDEKLVKDGDSWARLRPAFLTVLQQYGDAAYLAMRYVGGRQVSRDARGGKDARDPVVPVSGDKRRKALKFIAENILVDNPIPMRPELLRRVSSEHWMHWGSGTAISETRVAVPFYAYVQSIQNIAMSEALGSGSRMQMIETNEALAGEDANPLRMDEVFRTFTDAVWSDLKKASDKDSDKGELKLSKVRRNMQRTYLEYLVGIALGPKYDSYSLAYLFSSVGQSYPADARSLARSHIKEIRELIGKTLDKDELSIDEISRAHLEEIADQLDKTLEARVESGSF